MKYVLQFNCDVHDALKYISIIDRMRERLIVFR